MGVFYDVRVHLAENADDYVGKKGTTVGMGIRKVGKKETIMKYSSKKFLKHKPIKQLSIGIFI